MCRGAALQIVGSQHLLTVQCIIHLVQKRNRHVAAWIIYKFACNCNNCASSMLSMNVPPNYQPLLSSYVSIATSHQVTFSCCCPLLCLAAAGPCSTSICANCCSHALTSMLLQLPMLTYTDFIHNTSRCVLGSCCMGCCCCHQLQAMAADGLLPCFWNAALLLLLLHLQGPSMLLPAQGQFPTATTTQRQK